MGRSRETFSKKEVRNRKEKKRKEKQAKRLARKEQGKKSMDDMIAYVDEFGNIVDTPPDPNAKVEVDPDSIAVSTPKKEELEEDVVRTGMVTFFNEDKGYGFIRDLETGESIFVHVNNAIDEIRENSKMTFEIEMGPKGASAVKVKKV